MGLTIFVFIEDQINDKIFNFAFAQQRMQISEFLMQQDYIKEAVENRVNESKVAKSE